MSCPTLRTLDLSWNKIGDKGASFILEAIRETDSLSLEKVILLGNQVSSALQVKIE